MKLLIKLLCFISVLRNKAIYIHSFGKVTNNINEAFLVRYIVCKTKYFNIYIHKFLQSDPETFHDHPWDFISFIINGKFSEQLMVNNECVKVEHSKRLHKCYTRNALQFHRIVLSKRYTINDKDIPTTLVVNYNKRKNWNYLINNKVVNWRKYINVK